MHVVEPGGSWVRKNYMHACENFTMGFKSHAMDGSKSYVEVTGESTFGMKHIRK